MHGFVAVGIQLLKSPAGKLGGARRTFPKCHPIISAPYLNADELVPMSALAVVFADVLGNGCALPICLTIGTETLFAGEGDVLGDFGRVHMLQWWSAIL